MKNDGNINEYFDTRAAQGLEQSHSEIAKRLLNRKLFNSGLYKEDSTAGQTTQLWDSV